MILGIEIGGTKLQVGLASAPGEHLEAIVRSSIDREAGATGILDSLRKTCRGMISRYPVEKIGVGFGGPVDAKAGVVRTSYHVRGWDNFQLASWCQSELGIRAVIDNDCNVCARAEAIMGAGSSGERVFYVTVGTGIGGGLFIDGEVFGSERPAIAEIGHLRPFPLAAPNTIVEDYASGPGIAGRYSAEREILLEELSNEIHLTAKDIASAARHGDGLSRRIMDEAVQVLGWAIAQTITITAPDVVVVGGGVSLASNDLFMHPLRKYVEQYVMHSLLGSYRIHRSRLREEVVLHGAIALAGATPG